MRQTEIDLMLKQAAAWVGYLEKGLQCYDYYENMTGGAGHANWTRFGRLADLVIFGRDHRVKDGYPWCCMFILAVLYEMKAGRQNCSTRNEMFLNNAAQVWVSNEINGGKPLTYFAGCQAWLNSYKARGRVSNQPQAGDFVLYLDDEGKPYHIGIVESVEQGGSVFTTIEGNTSAKGDDIEPNGGAVTRKSRRNKKCCFLRNK